MHINYLFFNDAHSCTTPDSANFISHILCPNVSNYVTDGELHAMRCSVGNLTEKCEGVNVAALKCSKNNYIRFYSKTYYKIIYNHPEKDLLQNSEQYKYNGQVYQAHDSLYSVFSGTAKIKIDDNDLPLCGEDSHFNSILENSICRQLGYTNNITFQTIL